MGRALAGCGCVAPDVSAQGVGVWLQVVVLPTHTMPVLEEHSFPVPQTQVGEEPCGLEPSWGSQAEAVMVHRQDLSAVQIVFVVSELNHRFEPPSFE